MLQEMASDADDYHDSTDGGGMGGAMNNHKLPLSSSHHHNNHHPQHFVVPPPAYNGYIGDRFDVVRTPGGFVTNNGGGVGQSVGVVGVGTLT